MQDMKNDQPSKAAYDFDEEVLSRGRTEEYLHTLGATNMHHIMVNARRDELWQAFNDALKQLVDEYPGMLEKAFQQVLTRKYPRATRAKLEARMEGWIREHPEWTPNRIASTASYYFKTSSKALPFFRSVARRIKNRLRMREKRARNSSEPVEVIPPYIQTT
jgi:hypothetical protein